MTIAKEYLDTFHTTCVFHIRPDDLGGVRGAGDPSEYETWPICGKSAVAVYVSDDAEPKGRYVCQEHAEEAESQGDGPVFWQRGACAATGFVCEPVGEHVEGLDSFIAKRDAMTKAANEEYWKNETYRNNLGPIDPRD